MVGQEAFDKIENRCTGPWKEVISDLVRREIEAGAQPQQRAAE